MLQPVNDCYWSPKPRRDDVPITSTPRHVALPELKHCKVSDSVLSIVSTLHYASLRLAVLCSAIRATLHSSHYSTLLRATPRFSTIHCTLLRSTALLCTSLCCCALNCAPTMLRYTAHPRYGATLRSYDTLCCTALLYSAALHCAS